ncbi:MAG: class I SAM-dependent methyltransferase [Candidatus Paceibacterota bacterium]|jgi:2-polyprenyl-3-methyl-5-hydroxy-6-metoxy-1,4-benzoquinol methylase
MDSKNKNLTTTTYWEQGYKNLPLSQTAPNDPIHKLISNFFSNKHGECFEVGCYPGKHLAVFGELGFTLNGIDMYPETKDKLPQWLKSFNYSTGIFLCDDFLKYQSDKQYDVVCSFGFIEHFTDWKNILQKHASLVKEGGYIVVTAPNFNNFFQRTLRHFLDKQTAETHNISSIQPKQWESFLLKNGFEKIYQGYFGKFSFWTDPDPNRNYFQTISLKIINKLSPIFHKINIPIFASCCGIILKKK